MSHIELASQIIKGGNPEEMFVKNGLTIFPNPSKFFGSNLPRLFIYAELYNLENKPNEPNNTYTVEYIITDEAGSVVKEFPSKTYNKVDRSAVILHSLNIISLATGRYFLMVRATDNATKKITQSKEFFVVFREGESLAELSGEASFFSNLDEQGAQKAEHIISCIANKDEIKAFKQLDLEGKKNFLDRFWKERDPSPGTRTNETLMDYYKRYEEANQRFGSPNRPGWKSDMGRIYITYGVPAQIEKHEFESNTMPYQVWYYLQLKDQPTQTVFVFADRDGTGQNYLIHSNARGEYNNPSWQQDIRKDF
ncbi:GWxTD domain-containing protein [bacterium]|nr:GWxTD domain-containing protein [bacterium]